MWTALALAVLAGCGLLLLPIPLRLTFRWDGTTSPRWSFVLRLAGFALVRLPDPNAQPRSAPREDKIVLPTWLDGLIDWAIKQWHKRRARKGETSKKSKGPDLFDLLGRLLYGLFIRPTRRVRLDLAGFDPAALAAIHGLFLSVQPLLPGDDIFRLRPEWDASCPRVRLLWVMRTSMAGLVGGIVFPKHRA